MRTNTFIRPALSAAVAACLVLPVSEPRAVEQPAPVAYRPNVALTASSAPLPPPVVVVYSDVADTDSPPITIEDSTEDDTPAAPLTLIDVVEAIAAAGYLLVAGPLLVISIPLQLITGQSDAVITSLNDLISAANTILKLVGQSIPPIPTPAGDVEAEPVADDEDTDFEDADFEDVDLENARFDDTAGVEVEPRPETVDEPDEETDVPEDTQDTEDAQDTEETEDVEAIEDAGQSEETEVPADAEETELADGIQEGESDDAESTESEDSGTDSGTETE